MDLKSYVRAKREYLLLLAILLIALALRLVTAKYDRLLGADPWVHYALAKKFLELGRHPIWDYSVYYPGGTWSGALAGLHSLPAFFYKMVSFTGVSFFKIFQILPAIFGGLICIPLYLLAKEMMDIRAGLFSVLLFAISPAGISRTLAGYYRGEPFFVFFMLFTFLFYLYSLRNYKYIFAGGLVFLLCSLFWAGWPYVFAILSVGTLIMAFQNYVRGVRSFRHLLSYTFICGIGMTVFYLYMLHRRSYTGYMPWLANEILYIYGFFFMIILLLVFFSLGANFKTNRSKVLALSLLGLLLIWFLLNFKLPQGYTPFGSILDYFKVKESFITEKGRSSLEVFFQNLNILVVLLPVGVFIFFRRAWVPVIFTYFITSLFLLVQQVRFYFLASPVLCLVGGLGAGYLVGRSKKINLLIMLLLLSNAVVANNFASKIEPFVKDDLYQSLLWLKSNSPEDSGVFTWWDYTGPVIGIAERRTVLLSTPYRGRLDDFARLLATSDEKEAAKISRRYKVDYILIDDKIFASWDRILAYAGKGNIFDSVLRKMYIRRPLVNFRLVYNGTRVRIYRITYNFTKISTLEMNKFYYKPGEEMIVKVRFRSNEIKDGMIVLTYSGYKSIHVLKEGEALHVVVPAPSKKGQRYMTALLYDASGEKSYDRRIHYFGVLGDFPRINTKYLVEYLSRRW
jgi:dolichyl-diphosphooligosaccharide--protein glycosyltransferase